MGQNFIASRESTSVWPTSFTKRPAAAGRGDAICVRDFGTARLVLARFCGSEKVTAVLS